MQGNTRERGIGATAVVVVVAIIGLGGAAGYQYYQTTQTTDDAERGQSTAPAAKATAETIQATRAEAAADLRRVRANLSTDLDVAAEQLVDIRADLADAYTGTSVELQGELQTLEAKLDTLAVEIESDTAAAAQTIDELVAELGGAEATQGDAPIEAVTNTNSESAEKNEATDTSVQVERHPFLKTTILSSITQLTQQLCQRKDIASPKKSRMKASPRSNTKASVSPTLVGSMA